MSEPDEEYYDEFGFYSPQPLTRASRRQPPKGFNTGPEIGAAVPPIVLPSQTGEPVDVQANLGAVGTIVVFHRSAHW